MWFNKQKTAVSSPYFNAPSVVQKKNSLEYKEQKIKFPIVKEAQVKKTIDNRDPVCEELTPLNFNGLKDRVNFRLLKNVGNIIEVTIRCDGNEEETIVGTIQEVGTGFIRVLQEQKGIVTILWGNIREKTAVSSPYFNAPSVVQKKSSLEYKEQKIKFPIVKETQVKKTIDNRDPVCEELTPLNFNGLKDRVNFRLLKKIGNVIEVTIRCDGNEEEIIVGTIQEVGTDFIGVLREQKVIVTILWENIREIRLKDGEVIVIEQLDEEEMIVTEQLDEEEMIVTEQLNEEEMIVTEQLDEEEMIVTEQLDEEEMIVIELLDAEEVI
ncbi:hypothetical protein QUF88_12705 [Bacillus sp. DX1.1]|uniref:hypothetical protein n=1 Tax=unclassified Bacillus (in: firmicutes) TaxID=185979 RepID=UPI00256FCF87|nr:MULTISPECIES: hypothetical protein [unclassified Bacillus (in: firmicutes)]MDM5154661.1 hypothetical protein [Bacillus sp. DX1.1]WJE83552.1 hypothetical protein QRE67_10200 [Bacillus sp. DX3.1]